MTILFGGFIKKYEIVILTSILAFCSIIYELLLSTTLAIITGKPIWWQTLTIAIFIAGLGHGTTRAEKKLDQYRELFKVEMILSFLGLISVTVIYFLHGSYIMTDYLNYLSSDYHSSLYVQNNFYLTTLFFIFAQSITYLIGYFSGHEIPLLIDINNKNNKADESNFVLGINYIGTLFGTLCFVFVLLPYFDVIYTSFFVSILNFSICLYLLLKRYVIFKLKYLYSLISFILFVTILSMNSTFLEQNYLKVAHLFRRTITDYNLSPYKFLESLPKMKDIERTKSLYQYIDFFDVQDKGVTVEQIMALDMKFQYSTWNEGIYHDAFSHIPLGLYGKIPENVLVLGGGDGLLLRELLKYKEIQKITQVELDGKIVEMHKNEERFRKLNNNSLSSKRVETIIGDAFYYLRHNKKKYQAIFIDFPYPNNYNLSKLYSIEFYKYVYNSLEDSGFAVIDAPVTPKERFNTHEHRGRAVMTYSFTENDKDYNSVILSTLFFGGFEKLFPYKVGGETFVMFTKKPMNFDFTFLDRENDIFRSVKIEDLSKLKIQDFPYRLEKKYINSIFRPRLISNKRF